MVIDEIDGVASLERTLDDETRGIVLDFWGTWCQPCRSLRPHLERLADDHVNGWYFLAVHADAQADLVERFDVRSTPTIVYLRDGEEIHRTAGAVTVSSVSATLDDLSA